jgi:malate permease and related proteins
MDIFLQLVVNLAPLYLIIALGFFAGKYFSIDKHTLVNLILYVCLPIVVFGFVVQLDMKPIYALLPFIIYILHAIVGFAMLALGKKIYGDARANLLSCMTAMGNGGYFGLPLVLLLFKPEWVGVYMFMLLGGVMYEGSFGYYIAARGKFTVRDSIKKVLTFPSIYALTLGLLVNLSGIEMPGLFFTYWTYFKGAYVILGMMIIGAALSTIDRPVFSARFISLTILGKFVLWPALAFGFIMLDQTFLHIFDPQVLRLILVFSLVPTAANVAAFAAQFDMKPEKAATTILLITLLALVYIPTVLILTGMH